MRLRHLLTCFATIALVLPAPALAQAAREGDKLYEPYSGQPGKDVVWVPTPNALAVAMLRAARTGPRDIVYDLGSGDGRIVIAAAKEFGATGFGIEYNPEMVALARRNAERAGVAGKVQFQQADIFKTDFSRATVITMYLLPTLNLKLRDRILAMRPGTRVVSHAFDMGEWQADEVVKADDRTGYFWVVPARVAGRYVLERDGRAPVPLTLRQEFQMLSGTAGSGALKAGRVRGNALSLTLSDGAVLQGQKDAQGLTGKGWRARPAR